MEYFASLKLEAHYRVTVSSAEVMRVAAAVPTPVVEGAGECGPRMHVKNIYWPTIRLKRGGPMTLSINIHTPTGMQPMKLSLLMQLGALVLFQTQPPLLYSSTWY